MPSWLTYPYTPVILAFIGGVAALIVAWLQAYNSDLTEKNRIGEHRDLQERSNKIIESAQTLLNKQDLALNTSNTLIIQQQGLLESINKTLENTKYTLDSTQKIIRSQNDLIISQSKIVHQQIETIKEITGGDGIPRLYVRIVDTYSKSHYRVDFYVTNPSEYAIRSCSISLSEDESNFLSPPEEYTNTFKSLMLSDLPKDGSIHIKSLSLPFSLKEKRYDIQVQWLKGYYRIQTVLINDDLDFSPSRVTIDRGREFIYQVSEIPKYWRFEKPSNLDEIRKRVHNH